MDLKIIRSIIPLSINPNRNIEFFWSEPMDTGLKPLIILIHGHHPTLRMGGRNDIASGMFEFFAENGFVCVSMSQPGYGCSDGPADYCGINSQNAVSTMIDFFMRKTFVDSDRIVVQGWSRGANIAALSASQDFRIRAAILGGGLYNLVEGYDELSDGIRKSLKIESNGSREALMERSPFFHTEKLNIPILMVHGGKDVIAAPKYAHEMFKRLVSSGKDVELKLLEDYEHGVPLDILSEIYGTFLVEKDFVKSFSQGIRLNHKDLR